jgi:hypothetical protein
MPPVGSVYLIVEGVRRAVAARRAGLTTFPAVVLAPDGTHGPRFDVLIDELYSTKAKVARTGDRGRYARVEAGMADPGDRVNIPEIVVRVVGSQLARYFVRLEDVLLEP